MTKERIKNTSKHIRTNGEDMGRAGTHKPILSDKVDECVDKQTRGNESHVIHFFHPAKDKVNSPADKQDQKKS